MKKIRNLSIIFIVGILGLMSCTKDYVESKGNDPVLKATINVVEGQSIQNAINNAVAGDMINVGAGVYNEQIILKDQVNLNFQLGAILQWNGAGQPTITDNGVLVNCIISGDGVFKHITTSGDVISLTGDGEISIYYNEILNTLYRGVYYGGDGILYLEGDLIETKREGIRSQAYDGYITWNGGTIISTNYDAVSTSGGNFYGDGTIQSNNLSAISASGPAGSYLEFTGVLKSSNYATVCLRGSNAKFINTTIENTNVATDGWYTPSAGIERCGGDTLILDNVSIYCSDPNAYSMCSDGCELDPEQQTFILTPCYFSNPYQTNPSLHITFFYNNQPTNAFIFATPPITNLSYVLDFKGKEKKVILSWNYGQVGVFEVWKDGVMIGTTAQLTYTDIVPANFKEATYMVTPKPTLTGESILVTKN